MSIPNINLALVSLWIYLLISPPYLITSLIIVELIGARLGEVIKNIVSRFVLRSLFICDMEFSNSKSVVFLNPLNIKLAFKSFANEAVSLL